MNFNKIISMLLTLALLSGTLSTFALLPATAEETTFDPNDGLITHWDFERDKTLEDAAIEASNAVKAAEKNQVPADELETLKTASTEAWNAANAFKLSDKAQNGVIEDNLIRASDGTSRIVLQNDTVVLKNNSDVSYLYAESSQDLLRSPETRTIVIRMRADTIHELMEIMAQDGAIRWFSVNAKPELNGSTDGDYMGDNAFWSSNFVFEADTWYTFSLSFVKGETVANGKEGVNVRMVVVNENATSATPENERYQLLTGPYFALDNDTKWTPTVSDDRLYIGKNPLVGENGHPSGSLIANIEIDDIRIYNKAIPDANVWDIHSEIIKTTEAAKQDDFAPWGHNLTLGGDIGVNFIVAIRPYFKDDKDQSEPVTVSIKNGDRELLTNADVNAYLYQGDDDFNGTFQFVAHVAAKEMRDELSLTIQKGGRLLYYDSYNVLNYANTVVTNENNAFSEETVDLVKAMLNYGGYAQTYFGYNTENLANQYLTGVTLGTLDPAVVNAYPDATVSDDEIEGLAYVNATLKTAGMTQVVFTAQLAPTANLEDYTFSCENGTVKTLGHTVTVVSEGINVQSIEKPITLSVTKGDVTKTFTYTMGTYIKTHADSSDTDLVNLLRALHDYSLAAQAYVEAQSRS